VDVSNEVNDEGFENNVCSMAQCEGSMVKDYVLKETLGFVTNQWYLHKTCKILFR
jgi:hypothetical protein